MPKIRRLPGNVVDRIAAGEVVERPASVVKELVENALDAGASRVEVEVDGGGIARILVRDDGEGMAGDDARLALERHATSKIVSDADLVRVATFGFRGEALPSVASVSALTLTTSDGSSPEAVRLRVDHGGEPSEELAARPRGTDVLVEGLFAKTPARRKFLATPEAEARHAAAAVTRAALGSPSVAFVLRSNGKELLDAPAAVDRAARILQVFGRETLGELEEFEARAGPLKVAGYVTRGSVTFASRRYQYLFVNGRPVEDRALARAIGQASRDAIRTDRHPAVFLFPRSAAGGRGCERVTGQDAGPFRRRGHGLPPRLPRDLFGSDRRQGREAAQVRPTRKRHSFGAAAPRDGGGRRNRRARRSAVSGPPLAGGSPPAGKAGARLEGCAQAS